MKHLLPNRKLKSYKFSHQLQKSDLFSRDKENYNYDVDISLFNILKQKDYTMYNTIYGSFNNNKNYPITI